MDNIVQATQILKVDDSLGLVFGFAAVSTVDGEPHFDQHGDHIPDEVMLKAAMKFARSAKVAKEMHKGDAIGSVIHTFPLTAEIAKSLDIQTRTTGLLIAMHPDDLTVLQKFRDGTYTGFSIGGMAKLTPVE